MPAGHHRPARWKILLSEALKDFTGIAGAVVSRGTGTLSVASSGPATAQTIEAGRDSLSWGAMATCGPSSQKQQIQDVPASAARQREQCLQERPQSMADSRQC